MSIEGFFLNVVEFRTKWIRIMRRPSVYVTSFNGDNKSGNTGGQQTLFKG